MKKYHTFIFSFLIIVLFSFFILGISEDTTETQMQISDDILSNEEGIIYEPYGNTGSIDYKTKLTIEEFETGLVKREQILNRNDYLIQEDILNCYIDLNKFCLCVSRTDCNFTNI